jgi:16S rRNA processing protein RimM
VRGELRVGLLTDYPERLVQVHHTLYLGAEGRPYAVERVRLQKNAALIKLAGCDDRNAAEEFRGQFVQIPFEAAVPLEEGEYYHFQLVGVTVVTDQGEELGQVAEVLDTSGANDVYVVRGPRGEVLIPATAEAVRELDLKTRRMVVTVLPGLFGGQ